MATPPQASPGYSRTITPQMDSLSSKPDQSAMSPAPPTISSGAPRFPPPISQQDQIPSPSIKLSTMLSPANGVNTGSSVPHMSTPPGPPVFASPVRPAAVPFRTSPATPQPVAFSSASSLPTSSPPYFSNGSVELQQQLPSAIEEPVPDGKSPCVLFSAHKVSFFPCRMRCKANIFLLVLWRVFLCFFYQSLEYLFQNFMIMYILSNFTSY